MRRLRVEPKVPAKEIRRIDAGYDIKMRTKEAVYAVQAFGGQQGSPTKANVIADVGLL